MTIKISKLGDVCNIHSGNSIPAKEKKELYTNVTEGLPYVATKDIGFDGSINFENGVRIPEKFEKKFALSEKNSVLICAEGGSAGRKIAYSNQDCYFVNKLFSIKPKDKIDSKYLYYYLLSNEFQKQFKESLHGLIGGVSLSKIKNFDFTYPPLSDQQHIVAKLDVAFAEIDKAIYLEEEKKRQISPALKAAYTDILYNRQSSSNNKKSLLGKLCKIVGGNGFPKSYQGHSNKEIPFIKVSDMNLPGNEKFIYKTVHTVDINTLKKIKAKAHEVGTLIFPKIGGAICTNKKRLLNKISAYDNNIVGIKPSDKLLPEYLHKIFKMIDIYELSNKATLPSINNPSIASIELFVPNLKEQSKIIKKLNLVDKNFTNLSDFVLSKINNFKLLKSAIIKQNLSQEIV